MRILFPALVLSLGCTLVAQAPDAKPPVTPAPAAQDAAKKLDEARYDHFGAGMTEGTNVPVAEALADPAKYAGKTVRLEGVITSVCQTKGCWMHLGSEQNPVMVKFKDYAFFVPKNASGRNAVLEGVVTMKQETVEQTRHYLEDAGKHEEAKKITEGRKILTVMASGVAIEKAAAKPAKKLDEARYDHFGAGMTEGTNVPVAEALADPAKYAGKTVRLEGVITSVCQTKGCWMHLGSEQNPVMVKFKDYAFFVPKNASGRNAVLEGVVTMKQETVEQTRHYLEDAGKHEEAKKITEGRKILTVMASGVAIEKAVEKK